MKKIKTLIALLLTLSFLLCLISCGENNTPEDTTTKQEETTTAIKTDPVSLTIKGTDISEYTIVYAPGEYAKINSNMKKNLEGEVEKNRASAEHLVAVIKNTTGKILRSVAETVYAANPTAYPHAIFVGKTAYNTAYVPEGNNYATILTDQIYTNHAVRSDIDKYTVALDENNNISICGGTYGTTYHAVDAIETWLKAHVAEGKNAVWDETINLSGTYHIKIVACIGASITEGLNSTDARYFSYVANLNRLLWKDYFFINYGISGRTMRTDTTVAYKDCAAYAKLMDGTIKYDIVTFQLGTNDSYRNTTPWNDAGVKNFKDSLSTFIADLFENCDYDVTFIVTNCPKYYGTANFANQYILDLQLETSKELYSLYIYDLYFYDMNTYSDEYITEANFPDKLHPNDKGYYLMAEGLADALEDIEKGKENLYIIDLQ